MLKTAPILLKTSPRTLKKVLNNVDPRLARVFLPWALKNPRYLRTFCSLVSSYQYSNKIREQEKLNGLLIPPFLILSITPRCNLRCVGCYAAATGTIPLNPAQSSGHSMIQLSLDKWRTIISEASELGVFGFIIAGGEPFLYPGLLDLCEEFSDRFFLIVTNGTALTEADFNRLKQISNVAVIVSVEGGPKLTNARRGSGVYKKALQTIQRLCKLGVLTGISVTITRSNFKYWSDPRPLDWFISLGVRLGVFIEYIPPTSEEHVLLLTPEERTRFRTQILHYRATKSVYLVHSPGDEEYFGGCVSAGRGFAHITPAGDLTPCPVSNVATHNLLTATLREGLASALFKEIRENEHLLETEGMPCALFGHPEEVDALARSVGAYRTDSRKCE